jgi:molybdenum cofactor cytidylyltransferase
MGRENSRVGAIVLAGGRSTRMGEPKQLLRLGERTVLAQTLGNIREAGMDDIVLVLGSSAEIIRKQMPDSALDGLKVIVNEAYSEGMASSLREGLAALDQEIDAALIVLADQPFIRPATCGEIVDRYRCSEAQIVVPTYRGFRGNPVLVDRSVFHEIMSLRGDIGCRAIFGSHSEGIVKVDVEDVGILLDIDDRADFERLRGFGQSKEDDAIVVETATSEARGTSGLGEFEAKEANGDELVLVGSEAVVISLAKLGKLLNFAVTVVDPRLTMSDLPPGASLLSALDFSLLPETSERYVVVASRGRFDEEAVEQALGVDSCYVGLVANEKRGQELLGSLERKGWSAEKLAAIRVPAGVEIGAETPEEVAFSIMVEIVSRRTAKRRESIRGVLRSY